MDKTEFYNYFWIRLEVVVVNSKQEKIKKDHFVVVGDGDTFILS